jgi:predicted nucleotide-binding protein (sugar kinase/HSP70/actin superfamily)
MRKFSFTAKNEIKPVGEVLEYIHNKCNKTITTNVKEAIAEKIIKENNYFSIYSFFYYFL